jgi:MazG family protein
MSTNSRANAPAPSHTNHWELQAQVQCSQFLYLRIEVKPEQIAGGSARIEEALTHLGSHICAETGRLVKGCLLPATWSSNNHLPRSTLAAGDIAGLNAVFTHLLENPSNPSSKEQTSQPSDYEIVLTLEAPTSVPTSFPAASEVTAHLLASLAHAKSVLAGASPYLLIVTLVELGSEYDSGQQAGRVLFLSPAAELHPLVQAAKARCADGLTESALLNLDAVSHELRVRLPGFELPNLAELGHKTVELARVISHLRAPGGCPWDREQSFLSLRPFMIEEAYEAVEAAGRLGDAQSILNGEGSQESVQAAAAFADELGDVLLQILLNAQLAAEAGLFNLTDVVSGLTAKMIRRHPHVFHQQSGNSLHAQATSAQDVRTLWENIKASEGSANTTASHAQNSPQPANLLKKAAKQKSLPTLEYAAAVSKRAAKLGFCWTELEDVWRDVESEIMELRHEILAEKPDFNKVEDEIGDVVYALANVVVHSKLHLNPPDGFGFDDAVRKGVAKFLNRFAEMEIIYLETKREQLTEEHARGLDLDTWNDLWKTAKKRRYR